MKIKNLVIILLFANASNAQDIHWTQNLVPHLHYNPALTGSIKGNYDGSIVAMHRNQWASVLSNYAYQTTLLGFDRRYFAGQKNYWALGALLHRDEAGEAAYTNTQAHINVAYMHNLHTSKEKDLYLAMGFQIGGARQRFDFSKVTWSEQFEHKDFNTTLPSGEPYLVTDRPLNRLYGDVATGVAFSYINKSQFARWRWATVGVGLHHLSDFINARQTSRSFYPDSFTVQTPFKLTIHAESAFGLTPYLSIIPSIVVQNQAEQLAINIGTVCRMRFDNANAALRFGIYGRWNNYFDSASGIDALALMLGVEYRNLIILGSYDMNISSLNPASQTRGGFELSVIARGRRYSKNGQPKKRERVYCPE